MNACRSSAALRLATAFLLLVVGAQHTSSSDLQVVLRDTLQNSRQTNGCYTVSNDLNYRDSRICMRMHRGIQERVVQDRTQLNTFLALGGSRWILKDKEKVALHLNYADPFDHSFQETLTLLSEDGVQLAEGPAQGLPAGANLCVTMVLSPSLIDSVRRPKIVELQKANLSKREIEEWLDKELAVERHFFIDSIAKRLMGLKSFNAKKQIIVSESYEEYSALPEDSDEVFSVPSDYSVTVLTSPEAYRIWNQQQLLKQKSEFFKQFEKALTNKADQSKQ